MENKTSNLVCAFLKSLAVIGMNLIHEMLISCRQPIFKMHGFEACPSRTPKIFIVCFSVFPFA